MTAAATAARAPARSKAGGAVEDELGHNMGFQQCNGYSVTDLATTYNTAKTPEAVAEAVARTTPAQPEARDSIKQGCLDGSEEIASSSASSRNQRSRSG